MRGVLYNYCGEGQKKKGEPEFLARSPFKDNPALISGEGTLCVHYDICSALNVLRAIH